MKWIKALLFIALPLSMFLNFSAKMNERDYVGFSQILEVVKQFPQSETIKELDKLQADVEEFRILLESGVDSFEDATELLKQILNMFIFVFKFLLAIIKDMLNFIKYVFNVLLGFGTGATYF